MMMIMMMILAMKGRKKNIYSIGLDEREGKGILLVNGDKEGDQGDEGLYG